MAWEGKKNLPRAQDPGTGATLTHVIGVTGQHKVLMVGQYTRDPAEVVMNYNALSW